ncbi:helix-turn-helix domain-containing protein [Salidesulfovibrio onnuriiensis]|uniref:helix-turn-helix domain-containing protein n=1 Tax=Salidesulfovibrio onnuriiensis TaxID=2583823 RepID=UPI0011C7E55A|nr:helix-turn-helix domain-containing protein [Salidesulfovibrio onnuriiensis]
MDTEKIIRALKGMLGDGLSPGMTSIPHMGLLSAVRAHRLHSVALQQSAVIIILSGRKRVFLGEETTTLGEGDVFLYPAMVETTIENIPATASGQYMALCLSYTESMIADVVAGQLDTPNGHPLSLEALCARCSPSAESSLVHLIEMTAAHPNNEQLISLCLKEFLLLMAEDTNCLPLFWRSMTTWTARCAGLIGIEPDRKWTSQEIAGKLNVSDRSLRRHLQEEGSSLRDIIQEVRISNGLALLQTGGLTVGEAAYRCGYSSASRFSGLFKERFGVSPSDVLRYKAKPGHPLAESV